MNIGKVFKIGTEMTKGFLKKHGTTILVTTGAVTSVAATVWAVRNTIKHDTGVVLTNARNEIHAINDLVANECEPYNEQDARKDIFKIVKGASFDMVKIYIGPVILEVASLAAFISANRLLYCKAAGLATAYASLDAAFRAYRERVANRFGDKVEEQIRYAIREDEVEYLETDEKGRTKKVTETVEVSDYDGFSFKARFYDKSCEGCWTPNSVRQEMFINAQQNMANTYLLCKEVLTLNDVYDLFNMKKSSQGLVLGWVKGDVVEFHVKKVHRPVVNKDTGEVVDREKALLIDFNAHDITGFLPKATKPELEKVV